MAQAHTRKVLRLYRSLMRLATRYPESEIGWENKRVPMSDELRVEVRTAFRDNMEERDPLRVDRAVKEGERLKKMIEVLYQDGWFRTFPTNREYHTWAGLKSNELYKLKEQ
eukprot:TRINITY_DN16752_c0_g1_i1.p2 TRINITY_DN16752_c0_g1~~TRINITY_DN16752_c0_g1_i1.p2  ORF type:complete len:111 (+),score=39.42 TRINITY_DN16752_c0_g1_i1:67-399(+)